MASKTIPLACDDAGADEACAVQAMVAAIKSVRPGEYGSTEAKQDIVAALDHDSSFGLSPQFTKWEARFQAAPIGGVWELSDDGVLRLFY